MRVQIATTALATILATIAFPSFAAASGPVEALDSGITSASRAVTTGASTGAPAVRADTTEVANGTFGPVVLGAATAGVREDVTAAPPAVGTTPAAPAAGVARTATSVTRTPRQRAVSAVLAGINAERRTHGLVPLQLYTRMSQIAQVRTNTMASENALAHVSKRGVSVFELISRRKVAWFQAGEIIAWNNWPTLEDSAASAIRCWTNSPGHHDIMVSRAYNYVGIALTTKSDGGRFWSVVFLRGPDHTAPRVQPSVTAASATGSADSAATSSRTATWRWQGGEVRLATLTAGLRSFQVQRRVNGGRWVNVAWTRGHVYRTAVRAGQTVEVRVRGIDRRGNVGRWSEPMDAQS